MNPLKIIKESMPKLAEVLESIHAYLEKQLEVQEEIRDELKELKVLIKDERINKENPELNH